MGLDVPGSSGCQLFTNESLLQVETEVSDRSRRFIHGFQVLWIISSTFPQDGGMLRFVRAQFTSLSWCTEKWQMEFENLRAIRQVWGPMKSVLMKILFCRLARISLLLVESSLNPRKSMMGRNARGSDV
jgi:hypothetical protein